MRLAAGCAVEASPHRAIGEKREGLSPSILRQLAAGLCPASHPAAEPQAEIKKGRVLRPGPMRRSGAR